MRQEQENEQSMATKAKFSKTSRPRAALGDVGNRPFASKVIIFILLGWIATRSAKINCLA